MSRAWLSLGASSEPGRVEGGCQPLRGLAALFLVFALAGCSVGRPGDDATGEEIYQQLCANCHAEDLTGGLGPALGPGSNSASQPDEFMELAVLRGRGSMPSFSSSLDPEQVDRLVGYLREEQQR